LKANCKIKSLTDGNCSWECGERRNSYCFNARVMLNDVEEVASEHVTHPPKREYVSEEELGRSNQKNGARK